MQRVQCPLATESQTLGNYVLRFRLASSTCSRMDFLRFGGGSGGTPDFRLSISSRSRRARSSRSACESSLFVATTYLAFISALICVRKCAARPVAASMIAFRPAAAERSLALATRPVL